LHGRVHDNVRLVVRLSRGFPSRLPLSLHSERSENNCYFSQMKSHKAGQSRQKEAVLGTTNPPSDDPIVDTPKDSSFGLFTGAWNNRAIMLTHRLEMSCDAGYSSYSHHSVVNGR
jgi:hypothetical protein